MPAASAEAAGLHRAMPGYHPTPVHELPGVARELGLGAVAVKDESDRFGLPAFKVLGASWAIERTLREQPAVHTLVAASAGNHGRAVAWVAKTRGLRCRVFLPTRSAIERRTAIAAEGADVDVVEGDYEAAVALAHRASRGPGVAEIADVGSTKPAVWVIDGYATLFDELGAQGPLPDVMLVPVGVGSLAAAAARWAAGTGTRVLAIEPVSAACLTASLSAGRPTTVTTPGTSMAGLDCAEVSAAAWPSLRAGIHAALTVDDAQARAAIRELAEHGLRIGESGAATLAGLRSLITDPAAGGLRDGLELDPTSRVILIATEGPTDQTAYRAAIG